MSDKAFPTSRPVLLSDVTRETSWFEIECRQCGHYGRLSVLRLIREHGAAATGTRRPLDSGLPAKLPDLPRYMPPLPPYKPPRWKGEKR